MYVMQCSVCGLPASLQCGKCNRAYYCEAACQKDDWRASHCVACPVLLGDPIKLILDATDPITVLKMMNNYSAFNALVSDMTAPYEWKKLSKEVRRKLSNKAYSAFWKKRAADSCGPIVEWGLPVKIGESGKIENWFKAWFHFQLGNAVLQKFISSLPPSSIVTIPIDLYAPNVMSLLIDKLGEQFRHEGTLKKLSDLRTVTDQDLIGLAVSTPPGWKHDFYSPRHGKYYNIVQAGVWIRYKYSERIISRMRPGFNQFSPHILFGQTLLLDEREQRVASLLAMRFLLQVSLQTIGKLAQDNDGDLEPPFNSLVDGATLTEDGDAMLRFARELNLARKEARNQYNGAFKSPYEDSPAFDMSALED